MAINRAISDTILGLVAVLCIFKSFHCQIVTACAGVSTGTFVRNPESCRAYYYCSNGVAHPNVCPENFLFEPLRQICDIPSQVDCTSCSPFGVQHIGHPTDCSSYFLCVSGIRSPRSCGENLIFDKSIGDCNTGKCMRDEATICANFSGYAKIGDPNDCSMFYTCLFGLAYHQPCAPGLFFKPTIASCTFSEEIDFCQGDGPIMLATDYELE